ncbi:MAG: hypothetical protein AAGF12_28035 [Myxococcota bacterium]
MNPYSIPTSNPVHVNTSPHLRTGLMLGALLVGFALFAPPLSANGRVNVRVLDGQGRPTDGQVTLSGQRGTYRCRTTAGRCVIAAPTGSYQATVRPTRGAAAGAVQVTVPAQGSSSCVLRTMTQTNGQAAPITTPASTQPVIQLNRSAVMEIQRSPSYRRVSAVSQSTAQRVRPAIATQPATRPTSTTMGPTTTLTTNRGVQRTVGQSGVRLSTSQAQHITTAMRVSPTTPTGSPTTPAGGSGAVSGGSSGGVIVPPGHPPTSTGTTTTAGTVTATPGTPAPRNLGTGSRMAAQGTVLDSAGRPSDATITVHRGARVVGTVRTTAGRFSIFDVDGGSYRFALRSSRGTEASRTVNLSSRVDRLTLRVP